MSNHKDMHIVWFRQDLRLSENPALIKAAVSPDSLILPIYIFDDCAPDLFKIGSSSKWWLHKSLQSLNKSLDGKLNFYIGDAHKIIASLISRYSPKAVYCNTSYEPWHSEQEVLVRSFCKNSSIDFESFNGNYLWSPKDIIKNDGTYYKVFTAYKNKALSLTDNIREDSVDLNFKSQLFYDIENKTTLEDFQLLSKNLWHSKFDSEWSVGERAAQEKLALFIKKHLSGYKDGRNYPCGGHVSRLSAHLHFGEISPHQILKQLKYHDLSHISKEDIDHFISELIWREFSVYLMYHFPTLHKDNFNKSFDLFPWMHDKHLIGIWQRGQTGYPIIDAGMRELWQTGYMHNRVRMIVASFLVKNLRQHWHHGRDWFWDCLVDADLANNSASWQWVAGSGADAAPYFRIFNPITQGEKFDPNGEYTKKFVPELKQLPLKYLFKPWEAPYGILQYAGIKLGETYPNPIVEFAESRKMALESLQDTKNLREMMQS